MCTCITYGFKTLFGQKFYLAVSHFTPDKQVNTLALRVKCVSGGVAVQTKFHFPPNESGSLESHLHLKKKKTIESDGGRAALGGRKIADIWQTVFI